MDDGKGKFIPLEDNTEEETFNEEDLNKAIKALEQKHPGHGGWFKLDEIVELKGSRFRVKRIKPTEIVLKLLPKQQI
jgi:hypothetical protein